MAPKIDTVNTEPVNTVQRFFLLLKKGGTSWTTRFFT